MKQKNETEQGQDREESNLAKLAAKLSGFLFVVLIVFIFSGFFFVSDEFFVYIEWLWIGVIVGAVALIGILIVFLLAVLGIVAMRLWNKARIDSMVYPDENGNFPISLKGQNFNFPALPGNLPPDQMAYMWSIWQLTNNRNGTPPGRILDNIRPPSGPVQPGVPIEIIDPDQAPPILIEARSIAQEL